LIPMNPKLDLKVGADYTSLLTDRSFGFTVAGNNPVVNRKPLSRMNFGVGVAYNLLRKEMADDSEMTPEEISKMIDEKEDDMAEEAISNEEIEIGGDKPAEETETIIESTEPDVTPDPVVTPEPVITPPVETTTPVVTPPVTTTPDINTENVEPTPPVTTTPSTIITTPSTRPETQSPVYTESEYASDGNTVYRIQFVALSKDVKVFNDLKQYGTVILEYFASKGLYRYMVGDAATEAEGRALLENVRDNGWPKAFLVRYQDGVRTRLY